ncbi:MAG: thiamine pyrophosphate-dependent enzyme [Thermoanaerobaculia bacterium]
MSAPSRAIDRRAFVAEFRAACPDALVVAGLGAPAYDLFAAGDRDTSFYLWGGMGGAAAMGLGLALARPERSVVVLTGDGEQLMGLGALATIGAQRPPNLTVVVLDNGRYGETGMQESHTSLGTSLAEVARACGFAWAEEVTEPRGALRLAEKVRARDGCGLAQVLVRAEALPRALPPRDGRWLKERFRAALAVSSP